jgi:hypothetical protein
MTDMLKGGAVRLTWCQALGEAIAAPLARGVVASISAIAAFSWRDICALKSAPEQELFARPVRIMSVPSCVRTHESSACDPSDGAAF